MIEILNLRDNVKCEYEFDFYCDRRSSVGNKFYMKDESKRDEVCDKYDKWFKEKVQRERNVATSFWNYLEKMIEAYKLHKRLRIFCWCIPKRCHLLTIKTFIEQEVNG